MESCEISSVSFSVCLFAAEFFSKACDMQQFSHFLQEVRVSFNLKSDLVRKKKKCSAKRPQNGSGIRFSKVHEKWMLRILLIFSKITLAKRHTIEVINVLGKILFWSFWANMVPKLTLNLKKLMIGIFLIFCMNLQ